MKINMGQTDRMIRFVIGIALLAFAFLSGSSLNANAFIHYGAIIVGIVMIVVSIVRFCPIYPLLGINTCKKS